MRLGTVRGNHFYILELAGVIIIFIGSLRTKEAFGFFHFPLIHGFSRIEQSDLTLEKTTLQKPNKTK